MGRDVPIVIDDHKGGSGLNAAAVGDGLVITNTTERVGVGQKR